jgi:single-stranded-DNA-specific exonuclease
MNCHWLVNRTNPEFLKYLSEKASISTISAQILVNRGIRDAASIRDFLDPSLENLHDPFLLPDMEKAVSRIREAVRKNETVFIHGDYDADGITSTSLLVSILTGLGLRTLYHIPDRITEGYGFSEKGIELARVCGASLIITVDCGISSMEEVDKARSFGIDVIITDHHVPPDELPDALAVIDPHRPDSDYPFKYLAGVGVAFKLVQALVKWEDYEDLLDLVAIGTVADSVPLIDENRIIVAHGLMGLNKRENRAGIRALRETVKIGHDLRSEHLSFRLIPRINAVGRLDDANGAVELFLTRDKVKAEGLASILEDHNRERQKISGFVLKSALDMIDSDNPDRVIVLSSPEWHPGVIGIAASRLVEIFYRPVFLFSENGSSSKGSARSISPFHLFRGISECADLLIDFGGHRHAAGISILTGNLPAFRERINHVAQRELGDKDMIPTFEIDATVKLSDIDFDFIKELDRLEPFGKSNEEPVFGSKGVEVLDHRVVSNNHLKMKLRQDGMIIDSIGFGMGDFAESIKVDPYVDVAFVAGINEWNGNRNLQLNLKSVRPSSLHRE